MDLDELDGSFVSIWYDVDVLQTTMWPCTHLLSRGGRGNVTMGASVYVKAMVNAERKSGEVI